MSETTLPAATPTSLSDLVANWAKGPSATIDLTFDATDGTATFAAREASRVRVDPNGDVLFRFDDHQEVALVSFVLTGPEGAYLDGLTLGWIGPRFPLQGGSATWAPMHFQAGRMLTADGEHDTRVLMLQVGRREHTYDYVLHLVDAAGHRHVIDPKICNEGAPPA